MLYSYCRFQKCCTTDAARLRGDVLRSTTYFVIQYASCSDLECLCSSLAFRAEMCAGASSFPGANWQCVCCPSTPKNCKCCEEGNRCNVLVQPMIFWHIDINLTVNPSQKFPLSNTPPWSPTDSGVLFLPLTAPPEAGYPYLCETHRAK
jgi:hypothetical protein